jgi:phosphatidylinositol alpha-mannosyltransferase
MRVGIVCPYSLDVPGGVQFHVRDLAEHLIAAGHHVSVLAPADDDTPVPAYVETAGRAVPVKYNGSVARVNFGPVSNTRVRRWLTEGDFDVVHIHEPISPSLSLLALWNADEPVVGTFHTANLRSRAMQAAYPVVRPALEKIAARIAVSEDARRTVVDHLGGDAVVIPNGVYVDAFASAPVREEWTGTPDAPTLAFLGRIDEPRKGLHVLCAAVPALFERWPGLRVLVAGRGDPDDALEQLGPAARAVEFLGSVSDEDKASLLRSVDVYVAPHTGGESFGIVLVEAMSAGTCVVASRLGAFRRVLDDGSLGRLFPTGDAGALVDAIDEVLADPSRRRSLAEAGHVAVRRYDWSVVAQDILAVYETVLTPVGSEPGVQGDSAAEARLRRLISRWRA